MATRGSDFPQAESSYYHWLCAKEIYNFQQDNIYAVRGVDDYFRLSPFITITHNREFYIFKNIADRLVGRMTYNRIFVDGTTTREWAELS